MNVVILVCYLEWTSLMSASSGGYLDIVKYLVDHGGVLVNAMTSDGKLDYILLRSLLYDKYIEYKENSAESHILLLEHK